jgi:hypothetical protein
VREIGIGCSRRLRAFALATGVAAMLAATSASPALAIPASFWGVVPQATPSEEQFQRLRRGGVDSLRIPVSWPAVQPVKGGAFNWSETDALVGGAARAGIEVLPFLSGAPTWAVPEITVNYRGARIRATGNLPVRTAAQKAGWKGFVRQAALRYGPNGSFWNENPAVPKRPVRTWQIWNEANFMYFVARPSPVEYGQLVKLSYAALRGVDRGAKLVLGGLFARPIQAELSRRPPLAYFAADFLDEMYERTPGIRSKFHGVALHPYTSTYKRITSYVEEVRTVMKANRDAGKGLWVTELSWSSKAPAGNAFGLLKRNQAKWHVQRLYWFSVDDQAGTCNFCDGSGLFGEGFVPKPSWRAFVAFAGGRP